MFWIDIACIVFVCVTANHLGLIKAIQTVTKCNELPVISCPKCFSFWSTLAYTMWHVAFSDIPQMLAISFLASYIALWLELFEGFIDKLYMKLYEKIITTDSDDTATTDADDDNSASTMPELW